MVSTWPCGPIGASILACWATLGAVKLWNCSLRPTHRKHYELIFIALSKKHPVCFALQIGGPAGQPCRGGPAGRIKMPGFSCRAAGSDRPGGQASRTRSTGRADRANGWPTGRADRPGRLAGSRGRAQHYENLDPRAALYIMKQFVNVSVVFIMLGTTKFIMFRGAHGV